MRLVDDMKKNKLAHSIEHLKECFDGKPWYGMSVMEKLDTIPWEIVNENKYGSKSIAVLVQHVMNWRIFVLRKLKGDVTYDLKIDGPNDWSNIYVNSAQEWDELKIRLQRSQIELLDFLSKATDELLEKKVPGKKYTFGNVLPSIVQHDIYHLGQIAMLHAMQGR